MKPLSGFSGFVVCCYSDSMIGFFSFSGVFRFFVMKIVSFICLVGGMKFLLYFVFLVLVFVE